MTGVERLVVRIMADATNYNRVFTTAETRLMTFVSIASAATISLSRATMRMAADWQDVGVAFNVMLGDASKASTMLKDIEQFAIATPFNIQEVARGAQLMHAYGVEIENVLPSLKALGNVVAGTGGDVDILNRVMYNFGQVVSQNRATAVDIRQFAMAGIGVKHFADTLGVGTEEFKKLVEAGEVGADAVIRTFNRLSGEGGKFHNLMSQRNQMARGQWKSFREELEIMFRNVGINMLEGLRQSGLLDQMRNMVKGFSLSGPDVQQGFADFFGDIKAGMELMGKVGREIGEAMSEWRDMLKDAGKDMNTLTGNARTFEEIMIRIPKIVGDLFRGVRIIVFSILQGSAFILEKLFQGIYFLLRQANKVGEFLGLGTMPLENLGTDVARTLKEEFASQVDQDIKNIDFGDRAVARMRRELEAAGTPAARVRDILKDIGQIRPPMQLIPPDMMKIVTEAEKAFKERGGYTEFMRKTLAMQTAFWTANPDMPGRGFMDKGAFEHGMMKQFQELEKVLGGLEAKLPPTAFKNTAEAQDAINRHSQKQVSLQERIANTLEAAKRFEEETAKAAQDIAREIQNWKDKELGRKRMP